MIYLNEYEPFAAQWLANLYPEAHTDQRSICDVAPTDLAGFKRVHLFAGIGGWEYALQLAGWPADRDVWTGSCPCQPFSAAGKQEGTADPRHLWPEFRRLIAERRPATVFGEQVASRLGREWLAGVRADLEALGYAVGAADLCAAGVGAPHIRQRLYWVADAVQPGRPERWTGAGLGSLARSGGVGRVAYAERHARESGRAADESRGSATPAGAGPHAESGRCGDSRGLAYAERNDCGREAAATDHVAPQSDGPTDRVGGHSGAFSAWADATWLPCLDGKARRVEPGIFPLAHGVPGRVGRLRAYGNAIVPQQAATFIRAFLAAEREVAA